MIKETEEIPIWNSKKTYTMKCLESYNEELELNGFEKVSDIGSEFMIELAIWRNYEKDVSLVEIIDLNHTLFKFICLTHQDTMDCYSKMQSIVKEYSEFKISMEKWDNRV